MTTQELKFSITHLVQETEDSELLFSLYTIMKRMFPEKAERIAGYEADGQPITEEELVESILISQQEVRAGKKIPFQQLKTEFGLQ